MTQGGAGKCGNTLLKVWLIALASCVCSSAWAQTNTEQQYLFDLQAAPMHESLVQYSKITRRSVLYESRLLRNKYSPALQGRYTASAALAHLLQGSGLRVKLKANGFALQPLAPAATAHAQSDQVINIQLYSLDSILLGQSRIMTTFGGDILAWSAQGDINAGRGAKTTQIFTPPRRVYDNISNVTINPDVPSTGAGIATLAPIAEVPPGDMDLIAPLGTIDAGEAGIRVSGNVNLAALHVVNAENIQVQGESKGIPIAVTVNVGALTSASSSATAAQETLARTRDAARSTQPSQIQVQVLGFGAGGQSSRQMPDASSAASVAAATGAYDLQALQVVGWGDLSGGQQAQLTAAERERFGL
ncbi:filamentous haemagglutinin family protein [Alcaligenes endophyticus]|uniref:Filamentous hemagglutinin family protein n=1 Tax=Alcaligenes endophyticus TaxID=1929088 RepID=A0ABT8EHF5_9BURK|nr:filamentous haemagglutinin family protein [Alcaligenes endophyticus]MDN4120685.1 filamentous hemagglutinin family protein [Alcaligenes endophyticus]